MSNYLNLVVDKIEDITNDTLNLILHEKDGRDISFIPGQFITLMFNADGTEKRRSYSIWTTPEELPQIGLAVKKFKDGVASKYLLEKLNEGDIIKALPPFGNFTVHPMLDNSRSVFFIGAGSGIAPLFSQLQSVLKHEENSKVVLFYGNHDEESIIFKDKFEKLLEKYPERFEVFHSLSQPANNWQGFKGRIDKDKTEKFLELNKDKISNESEYFLCGPEGMMKNVMELLKERGVKRSHIHREIYHIQILDETDEVEEIERDVTLIFRGHRHILTIQPGESILEKALEQGLDIPNSCQYGNCSTCKAKLLSGKLKLVEQTALTEEDIKQGFCLTCVGFPASDDVVILYEEQFN